MRFPKIPNSTSISVASGTLLWRLLERALRAQVAKDALCTPNGAVVFFGLAIAIFFLLQLLKNT